MPHCNPLDTFNFASVAYKPFTMNWAEWLDGATLAAASVSVSNGTLLEVSLVDYTVDSSTVVRFWVRSLVATGSGEVFVTVQVTASDGRIDARTYLFNVNFPGA